MKNKKQTQQDHIKKRFAERLGVKYTQYINDMLLYKLRNNEAKFLESQSNRIAVWEVTFTPREQDMLDGDPAPLTVCIVYDRLRKQIVTVSPPNEKFVKSVDGERPYWWDEL